MATIQGHSYVLAVQDLQVSTRFYIDKLGFQQQHVDDAGWSFVVRDNCRIMLGECPDDVPAAETGCHSWFAYIIVDDVDDLAQEFRGRGLDLKREPESKPWGLRELPIATPDGHRITFAHIIQ